MACPASSVVCTGDVIQATDHNTLRCDALTHGHCGNIGSATIAATTFSGVATWTGAGTSLTVNNNARVNGLLLMGDCANTNMTVGLTINQGANDDAILALKSSDIAHALVCGLGINIETDTYFQVQKINATIGGTSFLTMAEDAACVPNVLALIAAGGTASATKTTAGRSLSEMQLFEHDGANAIANVACCGNVFGVRARVGGSTLTRMLVDAAGDLYSVTAAQTFDDHCDLALLESYDKIRSGFTNWAREHEQELIDLKILGGPVAEGGLTNQTQLIRLLTGAVKQLTGRLEIAESQLRALNA